MAEALAQSCDASNDLEAIHSWLNTHAAASAQTRRAYEREARRLLTWLIWRKGPTEQQLPFITLPEATAFVHWLTAPGEALVPKLVLASAGLPDRQPVKAGLSRASLSQAVVILNGLYMHLNGLRAPWGPYAPFNPFSILKRPVMKGLRIAEDGTPSKSALAKPSPHVAGPVGKALSRDAWNEVLATIELMPRETPAQDSLYWQTWWMLRLQHHSVFRRHESVKALMSDVVRTSVGYELHVVGKGNKAASILMSQAFVNDLKTYRTALGLNPMPRHDETEPLIAHTSLDKRVKGKHVSESTLYRRVTGVFEQTANRLEKRAKLLEEQGAEATLIGELNEDVMRLREASLHGVRHTGITHLLDAGVSMRTTSKLARHASIATTSVYDSQDKREQQADLDRGVARLRETVLGTTPSGVPTTSSPLPGSGDTASVPPDPPHTA